MLVLSDVTLQNHKFVYSQVHGRWRRLLMNLKLIMSALLIITSSSTFDKMGASIHVIVYETTILLRDYLL